MMNKTNNEVKTMKRSELIGKRSANRKVFENQDHSRTAQIYLDAVHYQDEDGSWKEMDDTISEETDGNTGTAELVNKKGKWKAKFKKHAKERWEGESVCGCDKCSHADTGSDADRIKKSI